MSADAIGPELDELSGWELPPRSADRAEPVRVFESAEAALAFLAAHAASRAADRVSGASDSNFP